MKITPLHAVSFVLLWFIVPLLGVGAYAFYAECEKLKAKGARFFRTRALVKCVGIAACGAAPILLAALASTP